jgi:hypothetical protein
MREPRDSYQLESEVLGGASWGELVHGWVDPPRVLAEIERITKRQVGFELAIARSLDVGNAAGNDVLERLAALTDRVPAAVAENTERWSIDVVAAVMEVIEADERRDGDGVVFHPAGSPAFVATASSVGVVRA